MSDFWEDDYETGGTSSAPVADPWAQPDGSGGYGSDVGEAIQIALGDTRGSAAQEGDAPWWSAIDFSAAAADDRQPRPSYADGSAQAAGQANSAATGGTDSKGLIGRVTDFVDKNKSLTEMVLKGLSGAVTAKNAQKAATAQLTKADELARARNADYNASLVALSRPGLIGRQQALKRTDGSQVFGASGRLN